MHFSIKHTEDQDGLDEKLNRIRYKYCNNINATDVWKSVNDYPFSLDFMCRFDYQTLWGRFGPQVTQASQITLEIPQVTSELPARPTLWEILGPEILEGPPLPHTEAVRVLQELQNKERESRSTREALRMFYESEERKGLRALKVLADSYDHDPYVPPMAQIEGQEKEVDMGTFSSDLPGGDEIKNLYNIGGRVIDSRGMDSISVPNESGRTVIPQESPQQSNRS